MYHHPSASSYAYGNAHNDLYQAYWTPQGNSHHPRSVPTPPIPNQPVKKSRVSPEPSYYTSDSRRQDRRFTSPPIASPSKEEPRGLAYADVCGYYGDEEPMSATTNASADYYWGTGPKPSRTHSRHSNEEYQHDSAQTETAHYLHRRSQSMYPEGTDGMHGAGGAWNPRAGIDLVPASETSTNAARQAMSELFPELSDAAPYTTAPDQRHTGYYPSSYMSPSRRPVDPSGARSPAPFQHDRPRRDCSTISPGSLYPHPRSPMANTAYTYGNQTLDDNSYDDLLSDDDDETDFDEDDDDAIMRPRGSSPYGEASSPEGDSQDGRTKYSSPEITPPGSAYSRSQTMRGTAKKSSTSTSPRRPRKPIPTAASAVNAANAAAAPDKYDETDTMLVQLRQQGVSYKTIKSRLGLDEAESTLRGRYRTLTKPKSQRLRKPVWETADIDLLLDIVDPELSHIKWKQVSDTIVARGGSYRFGSSTCKKQYLALVAEGRATPLNEGVTTNKRRKQHRPAGSTTRDYE